MLEGLAAWILNTYLGKYVDLNTDQLSIALLSGKVELENLPLKKDALRHLGLPVEIKTGFIGKIKLQIPVRQIRSAPWVIAIEQLYLVASPLPISQWDNVKEENARQEIKLSALDQIEAHWRLENDSKDINTYYSTTYSSWMNFGAGIISDIIENIQLNIEDVHIRYEDNISVTNKSVAFGITIDSLSAQSCDANWSPRFCHLEKEGESFKLLEMQKFGIYWEDLAPEKMLAQLSLADLAIAMSPFATMKNIRHYILPPVSAQAHIKNNHSEQPLRSTDTPRFACDLVLDDVPITLIDWQYDQVMKCLHGLDDLAKYRSYRIYQPSKTVKEDPVSWWIYAINCLYPGRPPSICKPKPTWESCLKMAKQNVMYVKIYKKILATPTITLSSEEKKQKDEVEESRGLEELKDLREIAMKTVKMPNLKTNTNNSAGRSMLENWFPGWVGWYSSAPAESETSETSSPEAKQLEGEILQVLSDSVENNSIFKRDAVFGKFNFCLKKGSVNLCTTMDGETSPMLELEFKNVSLNIVSKPRTQAHLVELSLGALYLKDKITQNSLFSVLVGPPGLERGYVSRSRGPQSPRVSVVHQLDPYNECLFYIAYEKKPASSNADYRLCIQSKCLDIVYQPSAIKWLIEFLCLPHKKNITQSRIEAMKSRTKKELMKNWEQILGGRMVNRTTWDLQFDISAPQIIFVENFCDQGASMAVIDFGRLQLKNNSEYVLCENEQTISKASEEEETFLTPCSTPPQSEASDSEDHTLDISNMENLPADVLNETMLHQKIYERYTVELTDLQILVGKVKDNWRYAHNKGSSTLHVLDRFNISIQVERRVIHTVDPLYPSLTFNANLPKLVAHLNESKVNSARNLLHIITTTGLPSPFNTSESVDDSVFEPGQDEEPSLSVDTSLELSKLLMVQFIVDHMSLEVQSRGRSVAELQVSGVKVALMKRSIDMSVTLTVHSLLLVDALQTFGADFELLVASHKHVGMDSTSGSLRDSEPTSPISPASPDPNISRPVHTSPMALTQALSSLTASPMNNETTLRTTTLLDAEALITIEVILISGQEPMQIVNVQFNNLDIIANQETLVELVGFARRVFPKSHKSSCAKLPTAIPSSVRASNDSLPSLLEPKIAKTELTFDFHRLNVLLLRGIMKDGVLRGKKICTATMSGAKIQATVSSKVEIEGSLGGLQVLDLTPEGQMHQRIVSVGKDLLQEDQIHPMYVCVNENDKERAFSFKVVRSLEPKDDKDVADIRIRMASLWYTHSPHFVCELQSCATEFKQYMSHLARSIKSAATDMALGLVQARAEALAQSIYMNARLSSSIYGSAFSLSECSSPRKRRRSSSVGASGFSSAKDTISQTPYSPDDDDDFVIDIKLDIILDSPVVVLPRGPNSSEVFIAHLGRINVSNKNVQEYSNSSNGFHDRYSESNGYHESYSESRTEFYEIEIRNMNIFSLDTSSRRARESRKDQVPMIKPDVLYSCSTLAKPILHDTMVKLDIEREVTKSVLNYSNESLLPMDDDELSGDSPRSNIQITGSVVTALKVSLTRMQYEQVLDTLQWLTSTPKISESVMRSLKPQSALGDITEEDTGVTTLNMDPQVRAKLFPAMTNMSKTKSITSRMANIKASFELPVFTIELRGNIPSTEQGLIDVSFRDFVFSYEKSHKYETNIQVSLRSIYMEDLLQPEGSRQRAMMISSSGGDLPPNASSMSRSCPDITYNQFYPAHIHGSLPDHLETSTIFGMTNNKPQRMEQLYPSTPPPSPTQGKKTRIEKNLVLVSVLLVDKDAPNFNSQYNSLNMNASVDFNCLDLVISVESWVVLIDFFSASPTYLTNVSDKVSPQVPDNVPSEILAENVGTNITIRSLTMVLVKSGSDIAKANISKVEIGIKTSGAQKEVEGTLGSMSLIDLTPHGHLYKERFSTSGSKALKFKYTRHQPTENKNYDAHLEIGMSSVMYVHTKRFAAELQAFSNHFTQLQRVMEGIRAATSGQKLRNEPLKLSLSIYAGSPIILVPVSSKSSDLLVINLGQLLVKNRFMNSGDQNTISVETKNTDKTTILDVMSVELQNMDLYMGRRENGVKTAVSDSLQLGGVHLYRNGPSLLTKKFQVKFKVERNLMNFLPEYRIVPDMSIYGQLSTLDATVDSSQYRLLKGLFAFNLGEDTERILPSVTSPVTSTSPSFSDSWTLSSLKLDLQNVTLRLRENAGSPPFTCINFIKSRLTVETFSNLSQDIDLVSQEILVMDTRFDHSPGGDPPNVFTNILQPVKTSNQAESVQAEIHSRKRQDHTKFTVLLNNMRLMGVFDWWETLQKFIFQKIENIEASPERQKMMVSNWKTEQGTFEVKLNITDSELVVVENTAQWDTNAVILKSTTVVTYKPKNIQKPLSCNLNHCEMFSCILGMEDETALSIIDPITLNIDVNGDNKLEAQLQYLTVRLSYHDMKMFLQILKSLPKQLLSGQESKDAPPYSKENVNKLLTLGFSTEDCIAALEKSDNKLDDAAIWLTKYASPHSDSENFGEMKITVDCFEVKANCVSICIIDDCGDSDVPLLEFSLKDLCLQQNLLETENNDSLYRRGSISCILASDYYNRVLSGWEPIIEPWNCNITWHKSLSAALVKNRLNVEIRSTDILNVNVTSTLLDLFKKVKENWTKDYYSLKDKNGESSDGEFRQICQSPSFKRRSPFVPFALKNETGSILHFSTVISEVDDVEATQSRHPDDAVITVSPGETIPFSFSGRDKIRHQDSHKRKMHKLIVRVEGWQQALPPVSVDKVGVYFRHAVVEIKSRSNIQADIPPARIVFDITLEGSARKLITVRSAVLVKNKLPETIELKFESQYLGSGWVPSKSLSIHSGTTLAVPLQYVHSDIDVRPVGNSNKYSYCTPSISWKQPNSDSIYDLLSCTSKKGTNYRFCSDIVRERFVIEGNYKSDQPAHRISLLPTVKIVNLLPIDMVYRIKGEHGRITSGSSRALTSVDPDDVIEMNILVENFVSSTSVIIPAACLTDFACRIRLEDNLERKLFLQAVISCNKGAKVKITISAPYWIINKTGLPLVFRQAGTGSLAAGQFEEHEFARMLLPLLFSFSDHDASPTISARVGNHVVRDGTPQWCSNFHVQKGIQVRKLHVTMTDGRADTVFVVGIEIRPGKGRYRSTNIVTISPRYQVHNRSSYQLVFCQSYFTLTLSDPSQQKTSLRLMPNSHMPFHWPRLDQDQYLCVSIKDIPDCCWSGGLKIDVNSSTHVNIRDTNGRVYFLRLEIVLQGATFFIVFTDADTMPPPIRVDNFSEVSLTFAQTSCKEVHHSTARAHSSIPYAWDQPTQPPLLTVVAPGGICKTYDISTLGPSSGLTYENFIYIAFVGTFKSDILNPLDVENQELVLDVMNGNQVVLARKRQGLRSQLWRMTSTGHIQHEGSSPPYYPNQPRSDHVLVLDIEGHAPQPNCYSKLMLRRMDPRRLSTQLWKFTDDGLLCCAHYNMCVQAQDGFYGLRQGNAVVLGLPLTNSRKFTDNGVPIEQAVGRQRLRPGSGFLSVDIIMDGPTRVLVIKDMKEKNLYATSDDREWGSIALQQRPHLDFTQEEETDKREFQFTMHLQGLGVSVVCCKTPEELLYGVFSHIVAETVLTSKSKTFCVSIGNVQVDNQLFETTTPVVLYVTPPNIRNTDEGEHDLPAIMFQAEMQAKVNENAIIFKYLILRLKNISVILEELLLLKFCSFAGFHSQEEELINKDENDFETQRILTKVSTAHSKRYYFGVLQLVPNEIRLSVKTASKLGTHLQRIKKKLGLTLIKFEDAAIDLQAFDRKHPFETWQCLLDSIMKHFRDELMWQAGIILGSVDFLGNPLGFVNDVSEGLSGFFLEGNVSALVKNVTHGISNSAAKVTESLSDGLGKVAMDDRHEETRQRYKRVETGRSKDHLIAGFKGLGFGLLGGATSIFKQVYEGVANDGIQGAFSGMGKGLVGAFTKPVVGVLDFASETARAVRDSSSSKIIFERHRLPRCVHGYGGLLPRYSLKQSQGQQYLYMVNDKNYNEQLIAFEILGSASEDLQCIVSNERIRIVANNPDLTPIIDCHLINLISCKVYEEKEHSENRYYIEIVQHVAGTSNSTLVNPDPVKKPRVRCRTVELARTVAQQINYAKRLYTEYLYTLNTDNTTTED